ncbi:MAG: HupE/UreJ family protein [Ekhidna sp.]|nr:HupE/UreJ family protein [Ekhidna sp.]
MKFFRTLAILFFIGASFIVYSHPDDELEILEMELGQFDIPDEERTAEYEAALKRQKMRRLEAMPATEKFFLFIRAGIEHIIPKGLDHILFVLGLFFSSLLFKSLLWQVTAFTLAHTITLALAALNVIQIPSNIVEPVIALSIVWVAFENCVFKQTSKWRPFVVFAFGLLHGLGFASVLSDYGLPKSSFIPSLLAFNIGVELGQLSVLLAAFGAVWLIRKKDWYRQRVQIPASFIIALIGLFWFIERVFL